MEDREKMVAFIRKVATAPMGAWSNNPKQYLHNVITNTMTEARTLLAELGISMEEAEG